jgi:hypothetical protein
MESIEEFKSSQVHYNLRGDLLKHLKAMIEIKLQFLVRHFQCCLHCFNFISCVHAKNVYQHLCASALELGYEGCRLTTCALDVMLKLWNLQLMKVAS